VDVPFIMSILLFFLGLTIALASTTNKRQENIRADFYNLDLISEFEIVPDEVRLQAESEISNITNTQNSSYAQRSGHSTRTHRCNTVDHYVPRHLTFITKYPFYSKYTHAYGIPVVAPSVVSDTAVKKACYIVRFLFADRHDIRENMYKYFGRVAVIGRYQDLTQIPEFSHLPDWWNKRARGLGGTLHIPVSCGGEENLLCLREDRYYGDDIFFHETAHAVAELAIRAGPNGDLDGLYSKLQRSYNNAKRKGLWRRTYSMSTVREYFAEGVQSFFNCHISVYPTNGIHNNISTRDKLRKYDPELYYILEEVFPCKNKYYWCHKGTPPDPLMDCAGDVTTKPKSTEVPTQVPKEKDCVDKSSHCSAWSRDGYCLGTYEIYMKENCRKSCNLCPTTTPLPTTASDCVDKNYNCETWARNGYCAGSYRQYMELNCRKSCLCSF